MFRYDPAGFYSTTEREATTYAYLRGEVSWREIPFNTLPLPTQFAIMETLDAFFPTYCPHCGVTDEVAFLTNIGMKHCRHCSAQISYTPISSLPSVDDIKVKIWALSGQDIEAINEAKKQIHFDDSWTGYWNLYLKFRDNQKFTL